LHRPGLPSISVSDGVRRLGPNKLVAIRRIGIQTVSYRDASGSGTVDVSLTPTAESVEGIVNNGVLEPTDVAGTFTPTFHPGT
jgi:hypothetical protein